MDRLFATALETGRRVRASGVDGLTTWREFAAQIPDSATRTPVKPQHMELCKHDSASCTVTIDTNDNGSVTVANTLPGHFFVQLFRIPTNESGILTDVKLAQIAYNIGQFEVEIGNFPPEVVQFYTENRLGEMIAYV
jgi:hypothetical protein